MLEESESLQAKPVKDVEAAATNTESTMGEVTESAHHIEQLATLEAQIAELKAQSLRVAADAQNAKRRADIDIEKAHKFALERFSHDLLPVVDSLERGLALSSDDEAVRPVREGLSLTLKLLQDALARHHIEPVLAEGVAFNPEHHQAMATEDSDDLPPNSVVKVFQKGYLLHGRLLRPAMVVVSQAKASNQSSSEGEEITP